MAENIKVLDSGYVRFIEAWGHGEAGEDAVHLGLMDSVVDRYADDNEVGLIEAARQSTQGSFRGWEEDQKLLKRLYLPDPQHASPFEFGGMVIEVQAPIMVFREWHRHRTQSYNEMSARYAPMPDNNYIPDWEGLKTRGEAAEKSRNKQEQGTHPWNEHLARLWLFNDLPRAYQMCQNFYQEGLEAGVPKELARLCIPVGRYSRMRATANLRNWLAFMTLRWDPAAQWEIQQYAAVVADLIKEHFPKTYDLYVYKKTPEFRLSKFTDEQLSAEMARRGYFVRQELDADRLS